MEARVLRGVVQVAGGNRDVERKAQVSDDYLGSEVVRKIRAPLEDALRPLSNIAQQYLEDGLDEARPYWVKRGINQFDSSVELYCGRGGGCLITLADCIAAWEILHSEKFPIPELNMKVVRAREVYKSLQVDGMPDWEQLGEERQDEYAEKVSARSAR